MEVSQLPWKLPPIFMKLNLLQLPWKRLPTSMGVNLLPFTSMVASLSSFIYFHETLHRLTSTSTVASLISFIYFHESLYLHLSLIHI